MEIEFFKYQGAGNDFIMVDNRRLALLRHNVALYRRLCDRRFGIGADGFIMVQDKEGYDFEMVYFNSDGNESSMCGNGGRCITMFARQLGIIDKQAHFLATDGPHDAVIEDNGWVSLQMKNVASVETIGSDLYLNTGSPHYVRFINNNLAEYALVNEARKVRYNERFANEGTNVNIVSPSGDTLDVRTYERGVEDETLSCGTGVTAVALAAAINRPEGKGIVQPISTPGGKLQIRFDKTGPNSFENIWLQGPAEYVFSGKIQV
ncbi:MAG TPA: diaminopimelate epimerase [Bacteroidia bacterium]|nr:diaminopimelate epimerase [Bacteroidia bacterium]